MAPAVLASSGLPAVGIIGREAEALKELAKIGFLKRNLLD
jgi:hypothetical protein